MTPLTESELAEVAVALKARASSFARRGLWNDMVKTDALYAKIAALNEGADK